MGKNGNPFSVWHDRAPLLLAIDYVDFSSILTCFPLLSLSLLASYKYAHDIGSRWHGVLIRWRWHASDKMEITKKKKRTVRIRSHKWAGKDRFVQSRLTKNCIFIAIRFTELRGGWVRTLVNRSFSFSKMWWPHRRLRSLIFIRIICTIILWKTVECIGCSDRRSDHVDGWIYNE